MKAAAGCTQSKGGKPPRLADDNLAEDGGALGRGLVGDRELEVRGIIAASVDDRTDELIAAGLELGGLGCGVS